jgi:hypothetical protein
MNIVPYFDQKSNKSRQEIRRIVVSKINMKIGYETVTLIRS